MVLFLGCDFSKFEKFRTIKNLPFFINTQLFVYVLKILFLQKMESTWKIGFEKFFYENVRVTLVDSLHTSS